MSVYNSKNQIEIKTSIPELIEAACEMRIMALTAIYAAGSGHPGGSFSAMDILAALFLYKMRHDPSNPDWEERDRFFLSKAHIVPALYAALVKTGYHRMEDFITLRKIGSKFQGHTDRIKCKGIEMSGGSLGQGLGISIGSALSARISNKPYRVYCMNGDGELQEGSIWESVMAAGHYKLDSLCSIVDKNGLQIDGVVKELMDVDPLADKFRSFNWNVIEIDGHNMNEIIKALDDASSFKSKPTVIIARTVKGKGVPFMENVVGWHGKAPNREQFYEAIKLLGADIEMMEKIESWLSISNTFHKEMKSTIISSQPSFKRDYFWNSSDKMKVVMEPTRFGFGRALAKAGEDERVVTIHADISDSIKITDFEKDHPERKKRVIIAGIAEQNMMQMAAGLAKEGKIPVTGTYGVFATGRPWDQLRTTVCYANLNVKIAGAHGGISVGPDGATHQALEEITLMNILPNMRVSVPADSIETEKASLHSILAIEGPAYFRFGREATPVVTKSDTPFEYGTANIYRYRKETDNFIDGFDVYLGSQYKSENEKIAIIACGAMVPEAMRAAYILKEEFNVDTRVINLHTIKPIDSKTLQKTADEISLIVTVEEHQVGGFGNIVAGEITRVKSCSSPLKIEMIGVMDRFGESGEPWLLVRKFGLTAEHIVKKAEILLMSVTLNPVY